MNINSIPVFIKNKFGWGLVKYPAFLNKYKWRPRFIFFDTKTKYYIAVDLIFNQNLSQKIYETEIALALRKNKNLRVCLLTSSDSEYNLIKIFCKKSNIGLKIYSTDDINTIVPLSFEKVGHIVSRKVKKEGWFPRVILDEVKTIKKISFRGLLIDLANKLGKNSSKDKQFALICKYINKMLQSRPDFMGDNISFMCLSNLENIFQLSNIDNKDHVFHSARVFLIGCVIIDKFYDKFTSYYKDIFPGAKKINVEYIWLLTSLFHDIGRVKQSAHLLCMHNPKEENIELTEKVEEEMSKVWGDSEYQLALGNVVELIKHCKMKKEKRQIFTGYAIQDTIDPKISGVLIESYNKRRSHGVISCFEIAADLLRKIKASKVNNKTFLLYHIFPAVVSIALHDWHIWNELKELKIFPLRLENFPLGALLIYIDTWDDFKREDKIKISIDNISFTSNSCIVSITWYDKNDYLEEIAKYESFKTNINSKKIKLVIKISNEKEVK